MNTPTIPIRLLVILLVVSTAIPAAAQDRSPAVVNFDAPDGFTLGARYYRGSAGAPGILMLHQCNREGNLTGYEGLATRLAQRGFHVLDLDFRGFGASRSDQYPEFRGRMDEVVPSFRADVEAAYQFLIELGGVDGEAVGIIGASCGATQAIFLAQNHTTVMAFVFLSGSLWEGAPQAFDDVASVPVFIATAEGDRVTDRMISVFTASTSPLSRLTVYKGELHGTPLFGQDDRLPLRIVDWLADVMRLP